MSTLSGVTSTPTLAELRHYAARRSLGRPDTLESALASMRYVQADPIRAPARAQDLILRPRVRGYRAGDLERRYPTLDIEEDAFVNYGFVSRELQALMHPREFEQAMHIEGEVPGLAGRVLAFVAENGPSHPRDLDAVFGKQATVNYWGGSSQATTRALDGLHIRGHLRVSRRDNGIKVYAIANPLSVTEGGLDPDARARGLIHAIVNLYAPVPLSSLTSLTRFLRRSAPNLRGLDRGGLAEIIRDEMAEATIDGVRYVWPKAEEAGGDAPTRVTFLAPFDPIAWDRARFEHFHGWPYRFEAYTPAAKRLRGYYSLPLLWRERIIGWGNLAVRGTELEADIGFVAERPSSKVFDRELEAELTRMRAFLGLPA